MDGDDANDVMLDSTGPTVNKPPSVVNGVTDKVGADSCFTDVLIVTVISTILLIDEHSSSVLYFDLTGIFLCQVLLNPC